MPDDLKKPEDETEDPNVAAHDALRKATDTEPVEDGELIGDPELRERYRQIKKDFQKDS